jgi:hypothetical protein
MSEKIRVLYYALWIAQPIIQAAIVVAILRSGRQRQFKYFFAYIVTQILTFAVVFPNRNHAAAAFYASWVSLAISVALGFKVIHEAFLDAFRPFHTLRDLGTVLFKWAGLVMLLVAGVVSVSTNSLDTAPWMQAILTTQRCVRIIQVGMVLFLLFFARYLGVSRRQYSFGIALGFGCFAVMELSLVASWVGDHLDSVSVNFVNMAAYNCALLVWLGYSLIKSPARDAPASLLRPQRWEQSLADIHHPASGDSLIPMFEGMVDRALSRTQGSVSPQEEGGAAKAAAANTGGATARVAMAHPQGDDRTSLRK